MFNERLTAIGGLFTRKVEVFDGNNWNENEIPEVGNVGRALYHFTLLVVNNTLYIFGKQLNL